MRIKITNVYPISEHKVLLAHDSDGVEYTLFTEIQSMGALYALCDRVSNKGSINPELWEARIPYGSKAYVEEGLEAQSAFRERDNELRGLTIPTPEFDENLGD